MGLHKQRATGKIKSIFSLFGPQHFERNYEMPAVSPRSPPTP
jgi:hypothetical protein